MLVWAPPAVNAAGGAAVNTLRSLNRGGVLISAPPVQLSVVVREREAVREGEREGGEPLGPTPLADNVASGVGDDNVRSLSRGGVLVSAPPAQRSEIGFGGDLFGGEGGL